MARIIPSVVVSCKDLREPIVVGGRWIDVGGFAILAALVREECSNSWLS